MLTEIRRIKHNLANKKWRASRPDYFPKWRSHHPGYNAPCRTITAETWYHMLSRTINPKCRQWKWYGGKGIKVMYESIESFIADVGLRPSLAYSIDRIDSERHYEVGNCRWILKGENVRRMRNGTH